MYFSPEEVKILRADQVYRKYAKTAFSGLTKASIEADLDAITEVSIETLPLIKFLRYIHTEKTQELQYALQNAIELSNDTLNIYTLSAIKDRYNLTLAQYPSIINDLKWHHTEETLSSGSGSGALYAPGASNKFYAYELIMGSDNTTNPTTTVYDVLLSEETSGDIVKHFQTVCSDKPTRIPIFYKGSTADKDLNFTIDAGVGTEVIALDLLAGKYTS